DSPSPAAKPSGRGSAGAVRDLWSDPEFFALSEEERYFYISFLVVASQNENKIPANIAWLQREMATKKKIPIETLVDKKWLEWMEQDASDMLATCYQDASDMLVLPRERKQNTEKEEETETERLSFGEYKNVRLSNPGIVQATQARPGERV